jgi:hypothetical protein
MNTIKNKVSRLLMLKIGRNSFLAPKGPPGVIGRILRDSGTGTLLRASRGQFRAARFKKRVRDECQRFSSKINYDEVT